MESESCHGLLDAGRPRPSLKWYLESALIDETYEQREDGVTANHITLPNVGREHLHTKLVCKAANHPSLMPTAIAMVLNLNREFSILINVSLPWVIIACFRSIVRH